MEARPGRQRVVVVKRGENLARQPRPHPQAMNNRVPRPVLDRIPATRSIDSPGRPWSLADHIGRRFCAQGRLRGFSRRARAPRTTGVVRCDQQPRSLDLAARNGARLETVPELIVDEALARLATHPRIKSDCSSSMPDTHPSVISRFGPAGSCE